MTRMYIQPSFLNSCEEHGLWSGGNDQYRGDRSVDFSTFTKSGRARVEAFSDEALEANKEKRKTSIPLTERILPQAKRLNLLTDQMRELEIEYKSGKMSIQSYTLYRDILSVKRSRAEQLLKKVLSVKPQQQEDDYYPDETPHFTEENQHQNGDRHTGSPTPQHKDCGVLWVDELPPENSLKKPLQIACALISTAVRWTHATKRYIKTLQEV